MSDAAVACLLMARTMVGFYDISGAHEHWAQYRATVLSQDCETVKKLHDRNQINDDTYSNLQYGLVQGLFKDMDDANYKRKKADK